MIVTLKNLGPLEHAEFELGNLTVVCGMNNTGKTYATYALYGFLEYWASAFIPRISPTVFETLYTNGKALVPLHLFVEQSRSDLEKASIEYSRTLSDIFASRKQRFEESSLSITLTERPLIQPAYPKYTLGSQVRDLFRIQQVGTSHLELTLLVDKDKTDLIPPRYIFESRIAEAIKRTVYGDAIPRSYISSAERTGAAIFRKALENPGFLNPSVAEADMSLEYRRWSLLRDIKYGYALPVQRNIEFIRRLDDIAKNDSFLALKAPQLLDDFGDIIGGAYQVISDELYFVPKNSRGVRLTMDESSSAVRSLLDVGFYLRHVAKAGDLLMVDEPELNLHPENQRRIARLLAALTNHGVKVFITTHSDYIVKELNTLIMLNSRKKGLRHFMSRHGYHENELFAADNVKVYFTRRTRPSTGKPSKSRVTYTLAKAQVDNELGIIAESFDSTIDEMTYLQQSILFSEDEGH